MFDLSVCLSVCLSFRGHNTVRSVYYLCNNQFSVMGGTHTSEILPVTALPNHSVLNRLRVCLPIHSVFCLPVSVKIGYSPTKFPN